MAHDDNDFALCTGQLSLSQGAGQPMSQSQMQTGPALGRALGASIQDGDCGHTKALADAPVL